MAGGIPHKLVALKVWYIQNNSAARKGKRWEAKVLDTWQNFSINKCSCDKWKFSSRKLDFPQKPQHLIIFIL